MRYSPACAATSSGLAPRLCPWLLWPLCCRGCASGTGAGMGMNLFGRKGLAAFGAHHDWIKVLAAFAVLVQQRPPAFVDHVGVAPMHNRHHDRIEIETLLRQGILVASRRLLIWNAAQHALPNQLFQPLCEQ